MNFNFSTDIDRLSLHDSAIKNIEVTEGLIKLSFDWAKISHFKEQGLGSLVLGACGLKLNSIKRYQVSYKNKTIESPLELTKNLVSKFDPISENNSESDNDLSISLLMKMDNQYEWSQWLFEFDSFEFSWERHVTLNEWRNGTLPNEPSL